MTRNDIQACIHCFIHCVILQPDEISVQFQLLSQYIFSTQIWHFVFLFFCQLLMACNDRFSHKLLQRNSLSISFQRQCIWLNMTGYVQDVSVADLYSILDHFRSCFRYSIFMERHNCLIISLCMMISCLWLFTDLFPSYLVCFNPIFLLWHAVFIIWCCIIFLWHAVFIIWLPIIVLWYSIIRVYIL